MKKRTVFLILMAICICLWAVVCIPIHSELQEAVFQPSLPCYDAVRAYFDQQETTGPSDGDTVYLYTASHLAGEEQVLLLCPWIETLFRDVGTYGSSDWAVILRYAALSWDGGTISPSQAASPAGSVCAVRPDENTFLTPSYRSEYLKEISREDWGEDTSLFLWISAATRDSTLSLNAAATASVRWGGEFYIRRYLWPDMRVPFSSAAEGVYLNNAK